jgi:superfamily I DNA/RNA helicase
MEFRIADTFTDSLARLTGDEQKAAKTTAFDLQLNPANPGIQLHKLNKARDKNFWSARVSRDVRLILHRTAASLLLCYVDHHDAAYHWAEQRVVERHPTTGAAQLVEVRETVREIEVPRFVEAEVPSPATAATEDTLFDLADHLPAEAAEALLELATGGTPAPRVRTAEDADPFAHPDAQRRFRLIEHVEELERALEYPWEKWAVFLHPAQRDTVERSYNGPARVAGSAGTGKTVVALHRAAHLARKYPDARILLTTFSDPLARALEVKLDRLVGNEPDVRSRITVDAIDRVGIGIHEQARGAARLVDNSKLRDLLRSASESSQPHRFSVRFLEAEWRDVVDAWQLDSWESYRDVARLGRKTRLGEQQRRQLWSIFERVRAALAEQGLLTVPGAFAVATAHLSSAERPYSLVVVDEAQDIGVPQLRFLAALAGDRADGLFFAGDLGQRIFQTPFSWLSLGVDVRGRSRTLRINYRTSHQIRQQADRLLPSELADVDGNTEVRRGTVSAFNGPEPEVQLYDSIEQETAAVARWLRERASEGLLPHEIGVFVRSVGELARARAAVELAGLSPVVLDDQPDGAKDAAAVGTMHLAKGLEFRAVVVAACDDTVIPLESRVEDIADEADLEDVYNTERHLLYVACTRARDHLLVTGVAPGSEFLPDLEPRYTH